MPHFLPPQPPSVLGTNTRWVGDLASKGPIQIQGKITGNIDSGGTVTLCAGCELQGDITANGLEIEPGARFRGQVTIERVQALPKRLEFFGLRLQRG